MFKMLTHKAQRKEKKAQWRSDAGFLGLLCRGVIGLIVMNIKLRDIVRLLQTCKFLHYHPALRTVVGTVKPGMVKAIKANRKRGGAGRRARPLGKVRW